MRRALELARRAAQAGEVPVGALVVRAGKIIGEAHNQPITAADPTAHAEILALRAAAAQIDNYRLLESTLYVTLEPCPMCAGAVVHARIERVVFGTPDYRAGACGTVFNLVQAASLNHYAEIRGGVLGDACSELLRTFFRAKRRENIGY